MTQPPRRRIAPHFVRAGTRIVGRIFSLDIRDEVNEELDFHVEMRIHDLMQSGLSREEAEERAQGSRNRVRDVKRTCMAIARRRESGARRRDLVERVGQDIRFAGRQLIRRPGFAATAILTMALGISANTAIFSFIDNIVLRPLPYPDSDRMVRVERGFSSPGNFSDLARESTALSSVVAVSNGSVEYIGDDGRDRFPSAYVTPQFFEVLGIELHLGRGFTEDDGTDASEPVVILAHSLWETAFDADPEIEGRRLLIDGVEHSVVGVAPVGVRRPFTRDLWIPYRWSTSDRQIRGSRFLEVYGRLENDASVEDAQAEAERIFEEIRSADPETERGFTARIVSLKESIVAGDRVLLYLLGGAAGLVLLIACTNVAHLMLAGHESRIQEFAIRSALGGGPRRLVSQLLTESLVVTVVGSLVSIVGAFVIIEILTRIFEGSIVRGDEVSLNLTVLGFAILVAIVTGLIVGIVPAHRASTVEPQAELQRGGTFKASKGSGVRVSLIVSEVALAVLLVVGAGLTLRSFWQVYQVDLGMNIEDVTTVEVQTPARTYSERDTIVAFYATFLERLRERPEVESASLVSKIPLFHRATNVTTLRPVDDDERMANFVELRYASSDYLETLQIPLVEGRDLDEGDTLRYTTPERDEARVSILINETLANQLFPSGDAIGRTVVSDQLAGAIMEIVGVTSDFREFGPERAVPPIILFGSRQWSPSWMTAVVRSGGGSDVTEIVNGVLAALDPEVGMGEARSLRQVRSDTIGDQRLFTLSLLVVFAAIAIGLCAVGIYGVTSYRTSQRVHEMGIRIALGADSGQVVRLVVGQGLVLSAVGILIGLGGVTALRSLVDGILFEISWLDPLTYLSVTLIVAGVSVAANYFPARRASRVEPVEALRQT